MTYYKQKTIKIQGNKTDHMQADPLHCRTHWKLDAVGAQKKARQWIECGKTDAEKIRKTVKTKKHTKQIERSNTRKY
jgi:hypothetical protein